MEPSIAYPGRCSCPGLSSDGAAGGGSRASPKRTNHRCYLEAGHEKRSSLDDGTGEGLFLTSIHPWLTKSPIWAPTQPAAVMVASGMPIRWPPFLTNIWLGRGYEYGGGWAAPCATSLVACIVSVACLQALACRRGWGRGPGNLSLEDDCVSNEGRDWM